MEKYEPLETMKVSTMSFTVNGREKAADGNNGIATYDDDDVDVSLLLLTHFGGL